MKTIVWCAVLLCLPLSLQAASCKDFKTQQEAQRWFEKARATGQTGWKNLDRDDDGRACDCLPGGNGKNCPGKRR